MDDRLHRPGRIIHAGYERAYKHAIDKFDAIHRLAEKIAPNEIGIALTTKDVRRLSRSGKLVPMIGVENTYPLGTDANNIRFFAQRGARYMSLAHNGIVSLPILIRAKQTANGCIMASARWEKRRPLSGKS